MRKIIWCSIHEPITEQINELQQYGDIIYLKNINQELLNKISNTPDDANEAESLAWEFLNYIEDNFYLPVIVQPSGNPMFQYLLGAINGIRTEPLDFFYSYSERVAEEIKEGETIKKIHIFKHKKFIKV